MANRDWDTQEFRQQPALLRSSAVTAERSWAVKQAGLLGALAGSDRIRPDQVVHTIDMAVGCGCHDGRSLGQVCASHYGHRTSSQGCRDNAVSRREQRPEKLGIKTIAQNSPPQSTALCSLFSPAMREREAQMIPVCGDTGVNQVLHSVTFCGSDGVLMPGNHEVIFGIVGFWSKGPSNQNLSKTRAVCTPFSMASPSIYSGNPQTTTAAGQVKS